MTTPAPRVVRRAGWYRSRSARNRRSQTSCSPTGTHGLISSFRSGNVKANIQFSIGQYRGMGYDIGRCSRYASEPLTTSAGPTGAVCGWNTLWLLADGLGLPGEQGALVWASSHRQGPMPIG